MKKVAVIMAGGRGERFWPQSRKSCPKQFLNLTDDGKTMIQLTIERLKNIVEMDDIYVVTNKDYKDLVRQQLPYIQSDNILLEPVSRNTAPCIGLAAVHIKKKYKDAVMIVLPSDHLIKYEELYVDTLEDSVKLAMDNNNLVTIGVIPSYPETGYGYINFEKDAEKTQISNAYRVNKFVEKPNLELAKEYVASGKYLWNSGMFVWKVSSILMNIREFIPNIYKGLDKIYKHLDSVDKVNVIQEEYEKMDSESIDYAIMEKAQDIYTITGNFGWDDVGSWLALERINKSNSDGNIIKGEVITINSENSILQAKDRLIVTLGIKDLIIVDTGDALLISNKQCSQEIKKVIESLKLNNKLEYL